MKRIFHHWEKWECVKAGFYATTPPAGMSSDEAKIAYSVFLAEEKRFVFAMMRVLDEWPHSCDQFLSNQSINRIAWMGQASMCIDTGVPSCYRAGFKLLTPSQQKHANQLADQCIKIWEKRKANVYEKGRSIHQAMEAPGLFD